LRWIKAFGPAPTDAAGKASSFEWSRFMKWRYLLVMLAFVSAAQAQEAGEPQRGLNVARANCATCHAVGRGEQLSPNQLAPTFQRIANLPGMTPMAINHMMHSAHKTMPLIILPPEEQWHLVAYIVSLRTK
jgi:mono/diheme cytochrome c family protein